MTDRDPIIGLVVPAPGPAKRPLEDLVLGELETLAEHRPSDVSIDAEILRRLRSDLQPAPRATTDHDSIPEEVPVPAAVHAREGHQRVPRLVTERDTTAPIRLASRVNTPRMAVLTLGVTPSEVVANAEHGATGLWVHLTALGARLSRRQVTAVRVIPRTDAVSVIALWPGGDVASELTFATRRADGSELEVAEVQAQVRAELARLIGVDAWQGGTRP